VKRRPVNGVLTPWEHDEVASRRPAAAGRSQPARALCRGGSAERRAGRPM